MFKRPINDVLEDWGNSMIFYECECGVDKVFGYGNNIEHAEYCPKFKATVNKSCSCSADGQWHSPGCINRPRTEERVEKPKNIEDAIKLLYKQK